MASQTQSATKSDLSANLAMWKRAHARSYATSRTNQHRLFWFRAMMETLVVLLQRKTQRRPLLLDYRGRDIGLLLRQCRIVSCYALHRARMKKNICDLLKAKTIRQSPLHMTKWSNSHLGSL